MTLAPFNTDDTPWNGAGDRSPGVLLSVQTWLPTEN